VDSTSLSTVRRVVAELGALVKRGAETAEAPCAVHARDPLLDVTEVPAAHHWHLAVTRVRPCGPQWCFEVLARRVAVSPADAVFAPVAELLTDCAKELLARPHSISPIRALSDEERWAHRALAACHPVAFNCDHFVWLQVQS
jgi:hypothetical protein